MQWDDYKTAFEFDGSWRDVYVLGTSICDWQHLLDWLRSGVYHYRCHPGENATLLMRVSEMFGSEERPTLVINVGPVELNCHFFHSIEIEFDLDPREITNAVAAEHVFHFMRELGQLLNKEVILTWENMQEAVIFKFSPSGGNVEYVWREG